MGRTQRLEALLSIKFRKNRRLKRAFVSRVEVIIIVDAFSGNDLTPRFMVVGLVISGDGKK